MKLTRTLSLMLTVAASIASANTVLFTPHLNVIGDPQLYEVFYATVQFPSSTDARFSMDFNTNYPMPIQSNILPAYQYQPDGPSFGMSDFLFMWQGGFYGLVLYSHDGYTAGDLYQASGFQTARDVMGPSAGRPNEYVYLAPGGTLIGTGALTITKTGSNGVQTGMYNIDDRFSAPPGWLDGAFTGEVSSFVCGNGILTGSGVGVNPAALANTNGAVPEVSGIAQLLSGALVLGIAAAWRKGAVNRYR